MSNVVVDKELQDGIFKCKLKHCGNVVKDEDEADYEPYCSEECMEEAEALLVNSDIED